MQVRVIKLLTKLIKFWAEKIYKLGIRIANQFGFPMLGEVPPEVLMAE